MIKYILFFSRLILTILITYILAGCNLVSPSYTSPSVSVPTQWSHLKNLSLRSDNNFPYIAWWQKFNDPVLNQLMETGLVENNTVKKANANLEEAQGELKAVKLSWLPNLSAYAGYSTNPALGIPNGFYGIWPAYAMFNIFNTIALQRSATIEVAIQQKAIESTKLLLIGQIAKGYYTYIGEKSQLELFDIYINDLNEVLAIAEEDYEIGLKSDINVEAVKAQLTLAQSDREVIKNNILRSQNALRYLINKNPGSILTSTNFEKMNTSYPNIANLPATVLANRPDVSLAELQYRLSVQNKAQAYTQLLPSMQLDTFYGGADVDDSHRFGDKATMDDAYLVWTFNPAIFGEIDTYNAAQKAAYYTYIDTVRKALQEVDNSLISHQIANERYQLTKQSYLDSAQKYQLVADLYHTGVSSYASTLEDKIALDQAAIRLNQIKLLQMITLVNLYQDLGGGYRKK